MAPPSLQALSARSLQRSLQHEYPGAFLARFGDTSLPAFEHLPRFEPRYHTTVATSSGRTRAVLRALATHAVLLARRRPADAVHRAKGVPRRYVRPTPPAKRRRKQSRPTHRDDLA